MAMLVYENGQIIDDIELNLTEGQENVKKGNKHLTKARDDHKAAKKRKCCILFMLLMIGVGIVVTTVVLA